MPVSLLLAALLSTAEPSTAPRFGFDRVDLLSEDPGTWLHHELPMLGAYPVSPALRLVEQVKVVFRLPVDSLYLGASLASQSLTLERPLAQSTGLYWTAGLQTRLLFPRGVLAGLAYRHGIFRVGLSVSAFNAGTWQRPAVTGWSVLPVLGFGLGLSR